MVERSPVVAGIEQVSVSNVDSDEVDRIVHNVCNSNEYKVKNNADILDKVDISFSPTIIIPLITNKINKYKVRTLIDFGSGAINNCMG